MNNPKKQVVLITGTSRGIGRYLAQYYLEMGYLVVGCSRNKSDLVNDYYKHFELDISEEEGILRMFKYIRIELKRLDILINNAAINPAIMSAALLPYQTIEKVFKTNVFSTMICSREAVKMMARSKFGRIINIGSMASRHEVPGEALYTSSKTAIIAYTRVLSKEVAKAGITVNIVSPSAIETDLSNQINQVALKEVLSRNAIHNLGEMKDVSNTIDFLIKHESYSTTGQIIYLGGA